MTRPVGKRIEFDIERPERVRRQRATHQDPRRTEPEDVAPRVEHGPSAEPIVDYDPTRAQEVAADGRAEEQIITARPEPCNPSHRPKRAPQGNLTSRRQPSGLTPDHAGASEGSAGDGHGNNENQHRSPKCPHARTNVAHPEKFRIERHRRERDHYLFVGLRDTPQRRGQTAAIPDVASAPLPARRLVSPVADCRR